MYLAFVLSFLSHMALFLCLPCLRVQPYGDREHAGTGCGGTREGGYPGVGIYMFGMRHRQET